MLFEHHPQEQVSARWVHIKEISIGWTPRYGYLGDMCPWCSWICSRCLERSKPHMFLKDKPWFTIVKSTPSPEPNKSSGKVFKHLSPILHKSPLWLLQFTNSVRLLKFMRRFLSLKSGILRGKLRCQEWNNLQNRKNQEPQRKPTRNT